MERVCSTSITENFKDTPTDRSIDRQTDDQIERETHSPGCCDSQRALYNFTACRLRPDRIDWHDARRVSHEPHVLCHCAPIHGFRQGCVLSQQHRKQLLRALTPAHEGGHSNTRQVLRGISFLFHFIQVLRDGFSVDCLTISRHSLHPNLEV